MARTVDWEQLEHAYGAAGDVPGILEAIEEGDSDARRDALDAAYGTIYHQGTRYSATPRAIGRLVEIATRLERAPGEAGWLWEVLSLITYCVAGDVSPTRGPRHATGPIWGERVHVMSDHGETLRLLRACEDAAAPAVELCLRLVGHEDASVRVAATRLLAVLGKFAERAGVAAGLRARFDIEPQARVRAAIAYALTHVLPLGDPWLTGTFRDDHSAVVRVIAAIGLARRSEATGDVRDSLVEWLATPNAELEAAYAALGLGQRALGDDLAETALAAAFGARQAPAKLTQHQRRVLEAIAHNQRVWSLGTLRAALQRRRLPPTREELARRLGIEVAPDVLADRKKEARLAIGFGADRELEAWAKVLELAPNDVDALERSGTLLVRLGQHAEARARLIEAAGAAMGDPLGRVLAALGAALHGLGDLDAAYEAFTRAEEAFHQVVQDNARQHRVDPMRAAELGMDDARQQRIDLLRTLGRLDEAHALEVSREGWWPVEELYRRGLAAIHVKQYASCIALLSRVVAKDPTHALAYYTTACAYALTGHAEQALLAVARAIEQQPQLRRDIAADADFASLRADPRFRAIVGGGRA